MTSTDPRLSGPHASADDLPELPVQVRVDVPLSLSGDNHVQAASSSGVGRHRRPPARVARQARRPSHAARVRQSRPVPAASRAPRSELRQAVTVGVTAATVVLAVLSGALIASQLLLR